MGKFSISSLVIIIWAIGLLALQTGCGVTLKRDHSPSATANNSDPGFSSSGDDSSDDSQGGDSSDDSSDGGDSNGGDDSGDGSGDGSDTVPADDETSGPIGGTGDDGSDDTSGGDDDGSGDGTGDPFPNSGILDIAFSDDGIFKYNQDQIDTASAVAVDSQDRILIIGTETFQTSPTALSTEIIATRLYPDGSPDNTFNSNVFITLNNISSSLVGHTVINDVLIQPNGKIVLVGMTNYDAMVLRLNENGTLDVGPNIETFGTSASSLFYGVAYQPDENAILAAGRAGGYHTIARFRGSDFQKDTTFGCGAGESYPNCDGVVRVSLNPQSGGGSYPFFDIAYEPDSQSIIAVGEVSASNIVTTMAHYQTDFAVARFDRHGNEQNYHLCEPGILWRLYRKRGITFFNKKRQVKRSTI